MRVHAVLMGLAMGMGGATASHAVVTPPTIANNTFASTPVGQSLTQTVTLTLTSAQAITSIALATGTAASSEYTLESVTNCTVDGHTSNAANTVCKLSVKYTPLFPGSLAAPNLSRNAQLLYTDGNSNVTAYGLSGAATRAIGHVVPGTITLYAGQPYTGTNVSPLDNGLGGVTGGYAGNGVAATSAQFDFAPFNAIYSSPEPANASQPMAFDSQGNLYVIDGPNFIIRKIDNTSTHVVTTIAGTAQTQGYAGDGGAATSAKLNNPRAITLDAAGNIYFLDTVATNNSYYDVQYSVIRRIDAVTGIITAVEGQLFTGQYDTADGGGTCNLTNEFAYPFYQCGDGGLATYAYLNHPQNLALDAAGNFYLWASSSVPIVREIAASTGDITTIGNETNLNSVEIYGGMTVGSDGNVYVVAIDQTNGGVNIKQLNPKTMVVTNVAGMTSTSYQGCVAIPIEQEGFPATDLELTTGASGTSGDLSADASGNIYVTDGACADTPSSGPQTIARVNIESNTAYYEARGIGYSTGGSQTAGYNSFYFYVIEPITAIPDNAGNIFFESWNQIAELSGQSAELNYTEMYDFQTSAAQTAAYTNLGNDIATPPTYTFQVGKNFVLLETGDTKACDAVTSVPIGGSCNLDIAFSPVQVGPLTDELNVTGTGGTETVTLTGTGDAAAQLSVSPTGVNFGNQEINTTSAPKTFTLTNTGTGNLTIYNQLIDGANLTDYAVVPNGGTCGSSSTSLTPGNSCTVEVTFTPTSLGSLPSNFYVNTSINFGDVATVTGTGVPSITQTGNLWFNPAPVAIAAASAQTLTATFTIKGEPSVITPTAVMHYGLAYTVGKVTCTGAAGNQTCTVPVTFIPNYPGGRKDALFLMDGTTRLATELAFGVGQSPLAAIQPGVVTNAVPNYNATVYDSVIDENGTAYAFHSTSTNSTLYSVTAAGVVTELTVPGIDGNSNLSIDGAGVIYFGAPAGNANAYVTYDTVQGIVGSLPTPVPAGYFLGIASGNEGNIYEVDNDTSTLYTIKPDGTTTTFALKSSYGNPFELVVDTNENLFVSNGPNGSTEEITPADVETQVDTTGGGLGIDAANTVYVERFYGLGTSGVGELPASSYANPEAVIDQGTSPTGNGSVAPDGTVYVGDYGSFDKIDRSQGTISFGEQNVNVAATPQAIQIYNGGNETLTLSNISISGEAFTIGTSASDNCSTATGIAAGALCNLTVGFLPTHAGVYSGTVTFTSNSLNNTTTTQTIALSGFVYGVYVTETPNPVPFGSVVDGNMSSPKTVTFTNNGDLYSAGLNLFSSTDPAFVITPATACSSIGVGSNCTATVTFAPTAAQAYSATISYTIGSSGGGPNQNGSFTVTGTGTAAAAPVASLSPTTLTLASTAVGSTSAAMSTTLSNTGNATLNISGITLSDTTDFAKTTTCGSTLAAGKTCTISVTFTPAAAQTYNATLSVADDASSSPQIAMLSGTGTPAPAPVASLSPTTLTLANTTVGSTSASMSTTLSNTGNATLNISGITLSDTTDFAKTTTCGSTLAAGKTCTISVTFTPAAVQTYTATLSVADNASSSPQTASLTGTGTGSVTVSPSSVDMGSETEYTENYNPKYITITNNTSATVTFASFASTDPSEFISQDYSCPGEGIVEAGTSCQISVRFFPQQVGVINAAINMTYTGSGGGTLTVNLSGTGTAGAPAIDLYPLPVNFGELPVGTAATPISLQVENTGTAPLTGISASITGASPGDYTESDNCSGVTIDPYPGSGACNITINFTPSAEGVRNATLNVTSNGGTATFSTPLTGAGIAVIPQTQFNPTQLNLFAGSGAPCANATGGAATAATLCNITGAAQDYLGNTYLVDQTYNVIYKVDGSGNISVFAGTPSKTGGYTGDGAAATSATLYAPKAVAADAFGNVYISDSGNGVIREVIAATGDITTIVTNQCASGGTGTPLPMDRKGAKPRFSQNEAYACLSTMEPEGLVVDNNLDIFFADTADNLVWEATPNGNLNLVAGDQVNSGAGTAGYNGDSIAATTAELNGPQDVALDPVGNLYIADTLNYRVRVVTATTGRIMTYAGNGTAGDTGDGGIAPSAEINVYGVATNLAGDLFITEGEGGIVRRVDPSGNITTFAGGGTGAIGGPAATGAVSDAYFARTDNAGDLLIPDELQVLQAGPDGLLQFGSVPQGSTSSSLTITLENTGDAPLIFGNTEPTEEGGFTGSGDFSVTGGTCQNVTSSGLAAGGTCTIIATFTPSAMGARTGTISVPSNAPNSPATILLQGTGSAASAPIASLSPTALSFPSTAVGSTAMLSTTLSNTGNATLNISGITLSDTTDFAETTTCGSTLDAGKTCTITVTFQPGSAAALTGTLSVADDANGSPQMATLSGTGTPAPAPVASLSPTTLAFPSTNVGATSAGMSTTLSNTGNATLTITGITLSDTTDFAETTTCGSTLAAGSNCTISVTFKPGSVASLSGTLSVADNAAGSPQTAALTGTGLTPPATDFTLTVTPPAVTVKGGSVATFSVNLKGIGGDFANAISLTVTGLPGGFTGTFAPASVTPGANGANSTLTIQTLQHAAQAQPAPLHRGTRSSWLAALLVIPLLGLRKRLRKLNSGRMLSCLLLLAATLTPTLLLSGCGGGYFAITSQTYNVTVTGTSGSIQHSTTVTLTVQQQ